MKIDNLKTIENYIAWIICENHFVVSCLDKGLSQPVLEIVLTGFEKNEHWYCKSQDSHKLYYGIKHISELYGYCLGMYPSIHKIIDLSQIPVFENLSNHLFRNRLCFTEDNCSPTASVLLSATHFINSPHEDVISSITLLAYSYTIYHEIGHIIHDSEYENAIDKENAADLFAYKAAKSKCPDYCKEEEYYGLLGMFLGLSFMLLSRSKEEEASDDDHPHSIERLYNLLNLWGISEDSYYWELAYIIICEWCKKNSDSTTWEKEASISFKEKFMDAYECFRKQKKNRYATPTT